MGLLNLPNAVSCSRIPLAFLFIHFFRQENALVSGGIMGLIMFSDLVDGVLARKMGIDSPGGNFVDRFADNVTVILVVMFFTGRELLRAWMLAVFVLRDSLFWTFATPYRSLIRLLQARRKRAFWGRPRWRCSCRECSRWFSFPVML